MLRHDDVSQKLRDGELKIDPPPSEDEFRDLVYLHLASDVELHPGENPKLCATMERVAIKRSANFYGIVKPHTSGRWGSRAAVPPIAAVSPDRLIPGSEGHVGVHFVNNTDQVIRIAKGQTVLVVSFHEIDLSARIKEAAKALKAAGAKEVYVFGSAADGRVPEDGDVDLAVSGLPPANFFEAMGQAASILDRMVDMVDLDKKTPFTEYLKTKGNLQRVA